jgi:hypothetical protein
MEFNKQCVRVVHRKSNISSLQKLHLKIIFPSSVTILVLFSVGLPLVWPLRSWSKETRKPSHHAKVSVPGEGFPLAMCSVSNLPAPCLNLVPYQLTKFCFHNRQMPELERKYILKEECVKWRLIAQTQFYARHAWYMASVVICGWNTA